MNYQTILLWFAGIIYIFLLFLILLKGRNDKTKIVYSFHIMSVIAWTLGLSFFYYTQDESRALFWIKFVYLSGSFIASSFLHFSYIFKADIKVPIIKKYYIYFPNILLVGLYFFTPFAIKEVIIYEGTKVFTFGRLQFLWEIQFGLYFAYTFYRFLKIQKKHDTINKMRIQYILIGTFIALLFSFIFNVLFPHLEIFKYLWVGPILSLIWLIFVVYAILKYRMMDISIAITRGTLFGVIYLFILIIPFGIAILGENALAAAFGNKWWLLPIFISIVIASLGPGIYAKLRDKAEWTLFRDQKQYQHTLVELGRQMTLTKNINELLAWITRTITTKVGISYTRIFLWDEEKKEYLYRKGYGKERRKQYNMKLTPDNPLIKVLSSAKEPMLKDEILNEFKLDKTKNVNEAKKYIRNTGAELIVPAMIKEKMMGFMTLGIKNNNRIYTPEDINMFSILASQAALAIENAEFHEKVRQSEAMLVQASKMSSLGQMATGFAHNVNNPFNSILFNVDMIEDVIGDLDKDKINEQDYKDLKSGAAAVKNSAEQGGEIIKSIMKFSSPSTGDRHTIKLKTIIGEALKLASSSKNIREVRIEKDVDIDLRVKVDAIQMEQVLMNLLINAADSCVEKGEEKKIFIKAFSEDGKAVIEVKDTGTGLKEEVKDKMFDYFFTTKRNEGTGLGLALSYQIVQAHDGHIEAGNSPEGGAVFTVKLPLA